MSNSLSVLVSVKIDAFNYVIQLQKKKNENVSTPPFSNQQIQLAHVNLIKINHKIQLSNNPSSNQNEVFISRIITKTT
jgi:hypothetical protein